MKKIIVSAAAALILAGCSSKPDENEIKSINSFLTDLSQVYTANFNGPDPDDITKIDFAVKRLYADTPEDFQPAKKGPFVVISADKVHDKAAKYFKSTIHEDQNTNEVDFNKDGEYQMMPNTDEQYIFSKVDSVRGQKGDTLLLDVEVFSCKSGWKGDINASAQEWKTQDPDNIPVSYKKMRTVIYRQDCSYRILSYTDEK